MSFQAIYFVEEEFKCPCCRKVEMNPDFITMIDAARALARVQFIITSGYRCEKHNKSIGSTSDNHPKGMAADIRCRIGHNRLMIITGLINAGFTRIGIGPTFIHTDINNLGPGLWIYLNK